MREFSRSISRMGNCSLGTTLPKQWCSFNSLNKSDKIVIVEDDDYLLIIPKGKENILQAIKSKIRGETNG